MKNCSRRVHRYVVYLMLGVSSCFLPTETAPAAQWQIEAGPTWRGSMNATAVGPSETQSLGLETAQPFVQIPALSRGRTAVVEANNDDITKISDRFFDDGFVGMDQFTFLDHHTVNFSYNANSQYDREANTLTFTRTERRLHTVAVGQGTEQVRTVVTDIDTILDSDDRFTGWGIRLDAFRDLISWQGVEIDWLLGLRGFKGLGTTLRETTFRQTVTDRTTPYRDMSVYDTITDTYVFETNPAKTLPPAPYYNENPNPITDPLISNTPLSATREALSNGIIRRQYGETSTSVWSGLNQIDIAVDTNVLQMAVGARLEKALTPNMIVSLRPAVLINVADIEADRVEYFLGESAAGTRTVQQTWLDRESKSSILFGIGMEAGVSYTITDRLSAGMLIGYELIDTTSLTVGPNKVEIDLSSYTCSAMLSYSL